MVAPSCCGLILILTNRTEAALSCRVVGSHAARKTRFFRSCAAATFVAGWANSAILTGRECGLSISIGPSGTVCWNLKAASTWAPIAKATALASARTRFILKGPWLANLAKWQARGIGRTGDVARFRKCASSHTVTPNRAWSTLGRTGKIRANVIEASRWAWERLCRPPGAVMAKSALDAHRWWQWWSRRRWRWQW